MAAPVAGAVPVLTASACQSMVSGLEVNIVYTASGLKSNPQFTIVAASASFICASSSAYKIGVVV